MIRLTTKKGDAHFSRQEMIEEELGDIVTEVGSIGVTPEQTLSRELQELAEAGVISFVDSRGSYCLLDGSAGGHHRPIVAQYAIDGFRSLRLFNVSLERGLNALVGPNGSGKTNFIDFLDFLSTLISRDASTAVSMAGGVARVFSQENSKKSSPKVTARVRGTADMERVWDDPDRRFLFQFEYFIEVRFSKSHSAIYISNERIKFFALRNSSENQHYNKHIGTISLRRNSPSSESEPSISIGPKLFTASVRNPLRYVRRSTVRASEPRLQGKEGEVLPLGPSAPDESILAAHPLRPALESVRSAISRGRAFNMIPSKAREPDELSKSPIIGQDGSGLSATLYHMQQVKRQRPTQHEFRFRRYGVETLDTVVDWARLVLPELRELSVSSDPHTGKYVPFLTVGSEENSLRFPLQSASDGTIKWLALTSMMLTRGNSYSIEEPENFLHPNMQRFLVELVRASAADAGDFSYFILSTHSETIINQLNPRELIVFRFEDGVTKCRRLNSPESVEQEINSTGFGLGYYYAANALS
ncbi:AAA family ATPase [Mesorhizobium sp. ASY16-5R]|uniref:AAA family ATPase n=1 Tax=Mesorhizobium sp. ASY16-5R TaxID=3445772 RepID=UPI003FA004E6